MRRHLLTLSLSNPTKNAEAILKTREQFIHEEAYTLRKNMLKQQHPVEQNVNRIFCELNFL